MIMSVKYAFAVFQMLTITLDESDSFAAWVAAKDAGFTSPDGSDPKCKVVFLVHTVENALYLAVQTLTLYLVIFCNEF